MKGTKANRKILLFITGLLTVLACTQLGKLTFNFDVQSMLPNKHEAMIVYEEVEQKFKGEGNTCMVVLSDLTRGVTESNFLKRLDLYCSELEDLEGVKGVYSLTNVYVPYTHPLGIQKKYFAKQISTGEWTFDREDFYAYPDVYPKFISSEEDYTMVYIEYDAGLTSATEIRSGSNTSFFNDVHWYGDELTASSASVDLQDELTLLIGVSAILILLFLIVSYRHVKKVLVSLILVLLPALWTLAMMAFFEIELNAVTLLTPSVISVVALSDIIHVINRLGEEQGANYEMSVALAYRDIGPALIMTSLTTSVGFLSLTLTGIDPFIHFGLFTAIGVAFAYFLSRWVLPIALLQLRPGLKLVKSWAGERWMLFVQQKHLAIVLAFSALTVISVFAWTRVQTDSKVFRDFAADNELSSVLQLMEEKFNGIRTLVVYGQLEEGSRLDDRVVMESLDRVEKYLFESYGAKEVSGPATTIKRINRSFHLASPKHYVVPKEKDFDKSMEYLLNNSGELRTQDHMSFDDSSFLIRAKTPDFGSHQSGQKNDELIGFLEQIDVPIRWQITGQNHLLDLGHKRMIEALLLGLLIALLVVSVVIWIAFKSWRFLFVALVVNAMPILFMGGVFYVLDEGVSMATSIVFTILFGIAVDDTIHFLSRYRVEYERINNQMIALQRTCKTSGLALVRTSVVLIMGFGVLLLSSYNSTQLAGGLIALGLCFALITDLVLLPAILLKTKING